MIKFVGSDNLEHFYRHSTNKQTNKERNRAQFICCMRSKQDVIIVFAHVVMVAMTMQVLVIVIVLVLQQGR